MRILFPMFLVLLSQSAFAQQPPSAEDIIRSLQASGNSGASRIDVDEIKRGLKNSIAIEPADSSKQNQPQASQPNTRSIAVLADRPSISFEIYFDYNSSSIKPESAARLAALGQALQDNRLSGSQFLIAGHTDGAGSRDYNLRLSQSRADAIKRYLLTAFPLESSRLSTIGFGKEQLRDPANPEAAINRRVQIVNIGD